MKDDYLWDGRGEPEEDIQELEELLGTLKYQPKPLKKPVKFRYLPGIAVAAAVLLIALGGIWWYPGQNDPIAIVSSLDERPVLTVPQTNDQLEIAAFHPVRESINLAVTGNSTTNNFIESEISNALIQEVPQVETENTDIERPSSPMYTEAEDIIESEYIALLDQVNFEQRDDEILQHFEQTEMLLRAFKNAENHQEDIAYEKQRARDLLNNNKILRRDAEDSSDIVNEEMLHNVETYLLDIANLRDQDTETEVTSIKNRIQQNEILLVLHMHGD